MREIKFRVWYNGDEYDKPIMIYDIQNSYDFGCNDVKYDNECCFGDYLDNENYVVMQYTNMKDKNGREVYEGDIVTKNGSKKGVVSWFDSLVWDGSGSKHSGFYCREWFDYDELDWYLGFDDIEVLGNIYENPELMED